MINLRLKNVLMKQKMKELSINVVMKMFGLKGLNSNIMRVAVK